jgi:hypothetical protein
MKRLQNRWRSLHPIVRRFPTLADKGRRSYRNGFHARMFGEVRTPYLKNSKHWNDVIHERHLRFRQPVARNA